MVVAGCGNGRDGGAAIAQQQTTSSSIDSSPGETSRTGTSSVVSTTVVGEALSVTLSSTGPHPPSSTGNSDVDRDRSAIALGATILAEENFWQIAGRKVGVIASSASVSDRGHIVDVLHAAPEVDLVAVFSPEHGFRSDRPSGEGVADEIDPRTGLPVYSLYGETFRPTPEMLAGIDVVVFDLQDAGTRYFTFISTMGLAMQAAAEAGVEFVVLDRPNPQGGEVVSGPVSSGREQSMVSMYPIPSVYGMTTGELATAIVGERWLDGLDGLKLTVIPMRGWQRQHRWQDTRLAWSAPSPGLPTAEAAVTYPSLVLLEATTVSYGQGTDDPFGQFGAPWLDPQEIADELSGRGLGDVDFVVTSFRPGPTPTAPEPLYAGQTVPGVRVEVTGPDFDASAVGVHLLDALADQAPGPLIDRGSMFDLLAGGDRLRLDLMAGAEPRTILDSWEAELTAFELVRHRYLLYE